jgi:hypothetical protein
MYYCDSIITPLGIRGSEAVVLPCFYKEIGIMMPVAGQMSARMQETPQGGIELQPKSRPPKGPERDDRQLVYFITRTSEITVTFPKTQKKEEQRAKR